MTTKTYYVVQIQHKMNDGRWTDYQDTSTPTLERAQALLAKQWTQNRAWLEHNTTGTRIVRRTVVTTDEVVAEEQS